MLIGNLGCSTWRLPRPRAKDVHPEVKASEQTAIEDFERRRNTAEVQAARTQLEQGNFAAAQTMVDAVLARAPEHPEALSLATELELAEEDITDDEQSLDGLAVIQSAPTSHAQKLLQQALSARAAGDIEGAVTAAKQAMDAERGNSAIPLAFSVHLLKSGHADQAVMLLTFAATRFPGRPEIHRALGAAHLQAGNLEEAQVVLQTALSLDSAHPLSYFLIGQALSEQGQPQRTAEMFRRASRLDSRYPQPF